MNRLVLTFLIPFTGSLRAADSPDQNEVKAVLAAYNLALTTLYATKAKGIFVADSAVFEFGGAEGSYAH